MIRRVSNAVLIVALSVFLLICCAHFQVLANRTNPVSPFILPPESSGCNGEGEVIIPLVAKVISGSNISTLATPEQPTKVKELNFVFLHGLGGTPCVLQLLSDQIKELAPVFTFRYQNDNPDTTIVVNTLMRCYSGYVDIGGWANNIADGINSHFQDKDNLILIGHSMGGKAALFAVAHDTGNLAKKTALVVTINSPIKRLDKYYVPGGGAFIDYCRIGLLGSDRGACSSLAYYDSSVDGAIVNRNKHWLAFVSAEGTPLSTKFDQAGVDTYPRNLDDGVVPLPAQFSNSADVIYYGKYGHSDLATHNNVARSIALQILHYIFGDPVECSVLTRSGTVEHEADWLLGTDQWNEVVGEIVASTGTIQHTNPSFLKWQEWEDIVGYCPEPEKRSSSHIESLSFPLITSVQQASWADPTNLYNCRLYIRSKAAPRNSVEAEWTIYSRGLLPIGTERSFYDVEITEGTPLTSIQYISWSDGDPRDLRLWISSEAQSPFRWFKAEWRTYQQQVRQRKVIDGIPAELATPID
ncbi:hypothetical protein ACFLYC_01205 [Chloroflexota bacterium]